MDTPLGDLDPSKRIRGCVCVCVCVCLAPNVCAREDPPEKRAAGPGVLNFHTTNVSMKPHVEQMLLNYLNTRSEERRV